MDSAISLLSKDFAKIIEFEISEPTFDSDKARNLFDILQRVNSEIYVRDRQ